MSRSAVVAASVGGLALASMCATPAQASIISTSACDGASLTQPFLPWVDIEPYKLAPGGDFEGTLSGWSLTGGAQQVSGSEPYGVTGAVGSSSLSLPVGATAQSPTTCVNAAYPTFRFLAQSATPGASVTVQVVYQDVAGNTLVIPVGTVLPTNRWQPTPPMLTGSAVPGAANGGTAYVALRFISAGGPVQIDDVEVDPRMT